MEQLKQITEQLASAVMIVDSTDLPLLAQIHSGLQNIEKLTQDAGSEWAAVGASANKTEKLVEKIILREVADAEQAVKQVVAAIEEIQQIVESGKGTAELTVQSAASAPVANEPKVAEATPTSTPAPAHEIGQEPTLGGDDLQLVQEFITEAQGHIESAEENILKLEDAPDDTEAINAVFRSFHTIKGVAGFLNLKQIGALAHAAENLLDLCRQGKLQFAGGAVDLTLASLDAMKAMINDLADAVDKSRPIARHAGLEDLLHRLHDYAEGKAVASKPAAAEAATSEAPAQAGAAAVEAAARSNSATASHQDAFVKIATDRLDSLINTVGELVIAQAMVQQDMGKISNENQRLARNMGQLSKITRELQDLSMSMRMVPIHGVFQKMARLVRDLGRKFFKEIELELVGSETELDRNVVEAINDPLVHMVRNSVDHGIETPEEREKAGKSRVGHVQLKAYHKAGNIVIEIRDDGKGLNKQKILKKAIEAGLVREGQELSDQEIFKLIFHAGLSTADKVTDVSGRGVGMDVVKRNIDALRGRVDIVSEEGKGSTFTIRLPLTLAVIDGLIVGIGHDKYILPITSVEQSIQPTADQITTVQNKGEMVMVRGKLLPLLRLHRMFGVQPKQEDPTKAITVIVQDNDRRCGVLVDELLGQQQVVIKSLGAGIGQIKGVSGGAILGDGNISLILDVPGLIESSGN